MAEPILVIMAAGMGSRYGGLKQMDPVGKHGELILDYSLFDARRAGFTRVVFIIKKENEALFREMTGSKAEEHMEVSYVFQDLSMIPPGFQVPENRQKPWGTGHAVLCCKDVLDAPFAVINADDYYGRDAFEKIYDFLKEDVADKRYAMVSYALENTLTENGSVARGVCRVDAAGRLIGITERTHIIKTIEGALYTEDGEIYRKLPDDSLVSMNLFGFPKAILPELESAFERFLREILLVNPEKAEFFLPTVVNGLLAAGKVSVQVLNTKERWYGVTYRQDREAVVKALEDMTKNRLYPDNLWEYTFKMV